MKSSKRLDLDFLGDIDAPIQFTRFEKLNQQLKLLGIDNDALGLVQRLQASGQWVSSETLVLAAQGLYHLTPSGQIVRVLAYHDQMDIDDEGFAGTLKQRVLSGGFDSQQLIRHLPKIHFTGCETLKREMAINGGVRATRQTYGRFSMQYTIGGKPLLTMDEQLLDVCAECVASMKTWPESSRPVFEEADAAHILHALLHRVGQDAAFDDALPPEASHTCNSAPPSYREDWQAITEHYGALNGWRCEGRDCPQPDLSEESHRLYYHCHARGSVASDDALLGLKGLCIACHHREPKHGFMKNRRALYDYQLLVGCFN